MEEPSSFEGGSVTELVGAALYQFPKVAQPVGRVIADTHVINSEYAGGKNRHHRASALPQVVPAFGLTDLGGDRQLSPRVLHSAAFSEGVRAFPAAFVSAFHELVPDRAGRLVGRG